jgi:D-arabinose 1-dehydrogenase-like Zn-dependent alcohol dehydrogenase
LTLARALVWNGTVEVAELPVAAIPQHAVLLKVKYALWSGIEEAIREGVLLPLRRPVVLGSSGSGRVVEAGVGSEQLRGGESVSVYKVSEGSLPGLTADGFLSSYAAVPEKLLTPTGLEGPESALLLHASLACDTVEFLRTRGARFVAIYGLGVFGASVLIALSTLGERIDVKAYTAMQAVHSWLRSRGFDVTSFTTSGRRRAESVVISSACISELEAPLVVLNPYVAAGRKASCIPRLVPGSSVELYVPSGKNPACAERVARSMWRELGELLAVVDVSEIDGQPPALEGQLGYIIRF